MARHPTSSRVHRDKQGPDDAFVSGVERSVAWGRKHQRALIIGGIALAVAVAGILYYVNYQRTIENAAASAFTDLQGTLASGNTQLAVRDLQAFIDRYGSTEPADQARLILAEIHMQEGQAPQAVQALGDMADDLDEPNSVAAARVKAAAYETMGQADQAVDLYLRIAGAARFEFQEREALADAARVRLQNGDADAAADLYQRIVDTFEADEAGRGYYEMWLAEARAQADEGDAAPVTTDSVPAAS